ncbi:MAG: tetratricopeptide repeat protein, partial [Terriglobia bacterium]
DVRLGLPERQDLALLRLNRFLPLRTLFSAGHSSPYYNEAGLGNIFYAQSWALTDYLMFRNGAAGRGPIDAYLALTAQGMDPVTAAAKAFGNLEQLQNGLQTFVSLSAFHYYRLKVPVRLRPGTFSIKKLSLPESEALRGGFLVREGRLGEARRLLETALARDPRLPGALQSLGLLELRAGQLQPAMTSLANAASLDPDCYLARFYIALALIHSRSDAAKAEEIRDNLNAFIRFNPIFAPPYAALAEFDAMRGADLQEARQLASKAIQLDDRNARYYVLEGEILAKMGNLRGALLAAQEAISKAQSPQEKSMAYVFLGRLQETQKASAPLK